ncbi:MAG TPA: hypothetical protein VFM18_11875 [Methanosarcina sp.]|nr:hypothetical protein [Methanosarcina sp.]
MTKETQPSVWDLNQETVETKETVKPTPKTKKAETKEEVKPIVPASIHTDEYGYDMEGLMTDFPTATELQKFVYDQTGVVLSLKGRANKLKYQVALDTLNGKIPPIEFLGSENPYIDKNDLIIEEPLKVLPPRDKAIDQAGSVVTRFGTSAFPHPDPEWKAGGQNCQVVFRKYEDGTITYEILGPIAKRAVGEKVNKFGAKVPEKYVWIDPRTGEQIIRRSNGTLTPIGTRLKSFMTKQKVNKSNQWDTWIDRDFVVMDVANIDNPWGE